jgi:hypothetical protein
MKKVWFFGDSTTYGHGLRPGFEFYEKFYHLKDKRWSEYISEYFNGTEINFGLCGGSNDDILFRLITNLKNIDNNDVVFIQWTHPARIGMFMEGEFKPINISQLDDEDISYLRYEDNLLLKDYMHRFIIPNIDNIYKQVLLKLLSIKKELELRGVLCVLWSPALISETMRNIYEWDTIYKDSGGMVEDDYHLGFSSQQSFSQFLINQVEKGNTLIKEFDEFWQDNSKLGWDNNDIEIELNSLFKKSNSNLHKDYDEGHIFI